MLKQQPSSKEKMAVAVVAVFLPQSVPSIGAEVEVGLPRPVEHLEVG